VSPSLLSGRRVLVVEDEIIVSWLLEDMLAELGCVVVGPATGVAKALALIEAGGIDAAVLDVNLNGETSYPIADALTLRGVPFIFSSGHAKGRLLEAYASIPTLQKPFHQSELADALTKLWMTDAGK
jgi:CheY-like chemotaxis protein